MPPGTNSARLLYLFYQEIFRRSFFPTHPDTSDRYDLG
jgi:hypothetical protein